MLAFISRGNKIPTDTYYSRWSAVAVSRALVLLTPRRPRLARSVDSTRKWQVSKRFDDRVDSRCCRTNSRSHFGNPLLTVENQIGSTSHRLDSNEVESYFPKSTIIESIPLIMNRFRMTGLGL
ncbi:hypothetical protein PIB30_090489 [Stylosanthes scabra]|uniref:Uncharacterized protein n=1 Tax=Stylosanthes scabra TaxID=79078 RepID=A0ABU6SUP9_9FABA|nr:hypothetical protein [Stylosanthes scabra]